MSIEPSNEINLEASYQLTLSNTLLSYCQYLRDIFAVFSATFYLVEEARKIHEHTLEPLELLFYHHENLITYYELVEFQKISLNEVVNQISYLRTLVNIINKLLTEIEKSKSNLEQQSELMQEMLGMIGQIVDKYWDYLVPVEIKYYLLKLAEITNIASFSDLRQSIIEQSLNDEDIKDIKNSQIALQEYHSDLQMNEARRSNE